MSTSGKETTTGLTNFEGGGQPTQPPASKIKNVWKYNVEHEFARISKLIDEGYTYVAMDTEFPGVIYTYMADRINESAYRILKTNVDALKLIQMGITLADANGEKPTDIHTWQFNLNFNMLTDKYNADSINLLKEAGINFDEMSEHGIDPMVFADFLMTSGLVVNNEITWIAFHGAYDFAYVVKVLINSALPNTSEEFTKYLKHCFPIIYDIKTMLNDIDEMKNFSLAKLGQELSLKRMGIMHQAGSDALLTSDIFFSLLKSHFPNTSIDRHLNKVFGIHNEGPFVPYTAEFSIHSFNTGQHYPYGSQFTSHQFYSPEAYYRDGYFPTNASMQHAYYSDQLSRSHSLMNASHHGRL